jgi:uncharacterized protein (DUF2384 family)
LVLTSSPEERRSPGAASRLIHLAELMDTAVPTAESAKIVECAKRIDAAVDLWMLDEREAREGLPPAP